MLDCWTKCQYIYLRWKYLKHFIEDHTGLMICIRCIEFKKKYKKYIITGKKRITIRKRCYVKEGEDVFVHCGGKIIGRARILKVEKRKLKELDDDIAREEGFNSKNELLIEIKKIYGDIENVYVINFEFFPFSKPVDPEDLYYGSLDLKEIAENALKKLKLSDEEKSLLELYLRCGSIKKAAMKLGGIRERRKIRDVLRKCYRDLKTENSENN